MKVQSPTFVRQRTEHQKDILIFSLKVTKDTQFWISTNKVSSKSPRPTAGLGRAVFSEELRLLASEEREDSVSRAEQALPSSRSSG